MKRLFACLILGAAPLSANASPELTETWGARAALLYEDTTALLSLARAGKEAPLDAAYIDETITFASTAMQLGSWIDTTDSAKDFGCIFRGMAEEADVQLTEVEEAVTKADRVAALSRLTVMFDDAQTIAAAAAHAARSGAPVKGAEVASCAANGAVLDGLLD